MEQICPSTATDAFELTSSQYAMWLGQQMAPDVPISVAQYIDLAPTDDARIDVALLDRACQQAAREYHSAQTRFRDTPDGPLQYVDPDAPVGLEVIDLTDRTDPEAAAIDWMRAEYSTPLDLSTDVLSMNRLLLLSPHRAFWYVRMHHSLLDGYAGAAMVRRVGDIYTAYANDQEPPAISPLHPRELVAAEEKYYNSSRHRKDLEQWTELATALPEPVTLNRRTAAPSALNHRVNGTDGDLPADLMREATERLHSNVAGVVLAAFAGYLARMADAHDVVLHLPVAARTTAAARRSAGMLANAVPVAGRCGPDVTVAHLVDQTGRDIRTALRHQLLPASEINAPRLSGSQAGGAFGPTVNIMMFSTSVQLGTIVGTLNLLTSGPCDDVALTVYESASGQVRIDLESNPQSYTAHLTAQHHARFLAYLRAFISAPADTALAELDVLTEHDRKSLAHSSGPASPPLRTVGQVLAEAATAHPHRTAVDDGSRTRTYQQLDRWADALAHGLQRTAPPGDAEVLVPVLIPRSIELSGSFWAVAKFGGAYVPLDPALPDQRLRTILDDAAATVGITTSDMVDRAQQLAPTVRWLCADYLEQVATNSSAPEPFSRSTAVELRPAGLDHAAYLVYTSGSTGTPKGVVVTHRGIGPITDELIARHQITPDSRVMQYVSPGFDASVLEMLMAFGAGATLAVVAPGIYGGPELASALTTARVTSGFITPAALETMSPDEVPGLARLGVGGDAISDDLVQDWSHGSRKLVNVYGPTETTIAVTLHPLTANVPVALGLPNAGTTLHVLDRRLRRVPVGMPGELYIHGPGVARCYRNRADLTAQRFVASPFTPGARLYRTGDLVRWDDTGLTFLGRTDSQVKIRGFRMELGEIEHALRAAEGVDQALVVATGSGADRYLVGYVTAQPGADPHTETMRAEMADRLPHYMIPAHIVLLDALPLTANGKVDRARLPQPTTTAPDTDSTDDQPTSALQRLVADVFAEQLGADTISLRDNFFDLGGNSLTATRLAGALGAALGEPVGVREVFGFPRAGDLADRLAALGFEPTGASSGPSASRVPRHASDSPLPLSPSQTQMWVHNQVEDDASYHIPLVLTLTGPVHTAALQQAIRDVADRHVPLRTRFPRVGDADTITGAAPQQVVEPADAIDIPVIPAGTDLTRQLADLAARPFDLTTSVPLRANIIEISEQQTVLLLVIHHISADGSSLTPLMTDLATAYTARCTGRRPHWTPLPYTYLDYTHDRAHLLGQRRADLLAYWRRQLHLAPSESTITPTAARPATPSGDAATSSITLDAAAGNAVRALADATGSSPFIVLHAATAATVARLAGQSDVVIGAVTDGRADARLDGLVGCFVNSVPLRLSVDATHTFSELVRAARDVDFDAFDHADLPFTELLAELAPQRIAGRHPIFQVMLNFLDAVDGDLRLGEVDIDASTVDVQPARFDLEFTITPVPNGGYRIELRYATDLFDETIIGSVLTTWRETVLDGCAHANRPVTAIPLVSDDMATQLAPARGPSSQCDVTLRDLILEAVRRHPDHVAVEYRGQSMTYAQMLAAASRLANHLISLGVGPESRVALLFPRSLHATLAMWSVALTGATAAPIDARFPAARRDFITDDCQAAIGLTDVAHRPAHSDIPWIAFDDADLLCTVAQMSAVPPTDEQLLAPLSTDQGAYLIYTSGSTGRPKGTVVTHAGLGNFADEQRDRYQVTPLARVLGFASPSFDAAMLELLLALAGPATLVIADPDIYGGREAADFIGQHQITHTFLTPSVLASMPPEPCQRLRCVSIGGEHWTRSLAQRWAAPGRHLHNGYGPSETTIMVAISDPVPPQSHHPLTIGRPVRGMRAVVLDAHLTPVPPGIPGELYVAGPQLARGYHHRPGLTSHRFVADPFAPGQRMYRTGDIVRWRRIGAEYQLEYLHRNDGQVKVRGQRVELPEIDRAAKEIATVAAAVTVVRDGHLATYVTGSATADEVTTHLTAALPGYMVPSTVTVLDEFPLSPVGKVDHNALPDPARTAERGAAPRTATERWLVGCFRQALGHHDFGVDDDFFDIGGNSLSATTVAGHLNERSAVRIPVRTIFEHRTVAALAAHVDAVGGAGGADERPQLRAVTPRPSRIPLSASQERMWLLNEIDPDAATYTIVMAFRMRGRLDQQALHDAVSAVIERHEVLRTIYPADNDRPHQVVLDASATWVPATDGPWEQQVADFAARPYDLTAEPAVRCLVVRRAEDEHVVALGIHHIAADGGSMAPLTRDLLTAYQAAAAGDDPHLPALPVQYADVALWQQDWQTTPRYVDGLAFWRTTLAGLPAEVTFPSDRPRGDVDTSAAQVSAYLPASMALGIRNLAHRHGATEFMVVHTALAVLLARMSGMSDVAIGTPVSGRGDAELTDLIGMFVNTLVLRTAVSTDASFTDLLTTVRDGDLAAFDHVDIPFEQLVDDVSPERVASRHPLFQVMLAYQNSPSEPITLPQLTVEQIEIPATSTTFDITVELVPQAADDRGTPGGIDVRLRYATARYDENTVLALARRFIALLADVVERPDLPVGDHQILVPSEVPELLRTPETVIPQLSLGQLLGASARRFGDCVALEDGPTRLTYRELHRCAAALAAHLRESGVHADDVVAVAVGRGWRSVVSLWACALAGAVYTPIDPDYPLSRIEFALHDADPVVGLTVGDTRDRLPSTVPWLCLDDPGLLDGATTTGHPELVVADGSVPTSSTAYMIYTSGSTGRPKGVRVGHRGLSAFAAALVRSMETSADSRITHQTSVAFDASVLELIWTFASGATAVVVPPRVYGPDLAEFLRDNRITHMFITPTALAMVPETQLPDLRGVAVGGDALGADVVARWARTHRLVNMYGPTESTVAATMGVMEPGTPITIGAAITGTSAMVLDTRLRPVAPGTAGELYLCGDALALGYHGQKSLTATRFVANPFVAGGQRLYRTGDQVRWVSGPHPRLEFLGRSDDQIKIRGFRVEVGEVTAAVASHDAVETAVVRVAGDGSAAQLVAYLTLAAGADVDAPTLAEHCASSLPAHMVPSAFVILDALPLTPNGKLDTAALPAPQPVAVTIEEPRSELEAQVCAAFSAVLSVGAVGRSSNFFELGGNSLLTVTLVNRLRDELSSAATVSISSVFTAPTPAELAAVIAGSPVPGTGAAPADESSPLTSHLLPIREVPDAAATVFAVHPAVGLSWSYAGLLNHLRPDTSLVGLQARGVAQPRPRPRSVCEVARDYVNTVLDYRPSGKVVLLGWSLGGLIAQAMARELKDVGMDVVLVLMDAYPLAATPRDNTEMSLGHMLREFAGLDVPDGDVDLAHAAEMLRTSPNPVVAELTADQLQRLYRMYQHFVDIGFRHLPDTYDGNCIFVRATRDPHPELTPALWQPYIAGSTSVHSIDCTHNQMAQPENLARIAALINDASQRELQGGLR